VLTSDAFVVVPGGIGTVLELMLVWQLLQVKHVEDVPLILVGKMWPGLVEWAKTSLLTTQPPLASPEDLNIPQCVNTADEAVALMRQRHAKWLKVNKT
jgi:predicted Rossmann-fold nucleotide-binding protein